MRPDPIPPVNHPNIAACYSFEEISGRYLLVQELLADEPVAQGLLRVSESALGLHRPEEKAVVIDFRQEGIYVLIVGQDRTQTLGQILWAKTT